MSLVANTFTLMHLDVVFFIFILLRAQRPSGTCDLIAILDFFFLRLSLQMLALPHFLPSLLGLQIHACLTFLCILMSLFSAFFPLHFLLPVFFFFFLFQFTKFLLCCVKPVSENLGSRNFPGGLVVRLCASTQGLVTGWGTEIIHAFWCSQKV